MPARPRSEFEKIALIERLLRGSRARAGRVEIGIGDDAAVLMSPGRLVWTIDSQVEGSHFDRAWLSLEDIGYRSFQAAASDLAAMGAKPIAALSNLALPRQFSDRELARLVRGQAQASAHCGCPVVGGNLSRAPDLSVTTTLLGVAARPLLRRGARPGDELWLWGDVGLAALGLRALQRGLQRRASLKAGVERWRRPRALLAEGRKLIGRARAAIDVSDGLAGDAAHLARESGVRVVFDAGQLEAGLGVDLLRGAQFLGESALTLALLGGEDYALLAAGPATKRPRAAHSVGQVERGSGVFLERAGKRQRLGRAFEHFAATSNFRKRY